MVAEEGVRVHAAATCTEAEKNANKHDGWCLLDLSATRCGARWRPVGAGGTAGLLDPTLLRPIDAAPPLAHIATLDLRRNKLKRLPDALDPVGRPSLANLKTLLLRGNSLKRVPPGWLGGGEECAWASTLEHVDLRLNKLDTLPHTVGELITLTTLLCSNNRLASVPSSVERCVNLRQLW